MLNMYMQKKQLISFSILVITLFALNGLFLGTNNRIFDNYQNEEMINKEHVSSQKLFVIRKIIKKNSKNIFLRVSFVNM